MAWTIIAPELVLAWAVRQWFGARLVAKRYKRRHFIIFVYESEKRQS